MSVKKPHACCSFKLILKTFLKSFLLVELWGGFPPDSVHGEEGAAQSVRGTFLNPPISVMCSVCKNAGDKLKVVLVVRHQSDKWFLSAYGDVGSIAMS